MALGRALQNRGSPREEQCPTSFSYPLVELNPVPLKVTGGAEKTRFKSNEQSGFLQVVTVESSVMARISTYLWPLSHLYS
jgi:hypothetical protein